MAALNFPLNPPLNYRYPETPIPGVATYSWDGEKWMVLNGDAGGGGDVITGPITGTAGDIPFTPAGDISAGNIQDAIVELDSEKIGEAPSDGKQYARKDAAWNEVVIPPSGLPEAPTDGQQYARQAAAWTVVSSTGSLPEAPANGSLYGRMDQAWVPVPGGATGTDYLALTGGTVSGNITATGFVHANELHAIDNIFCDGNITTVNDVIANGTESTFTRVHNTNLPPDQDNELVNKAYVDAAIAAGGGGGGAYLPLTGGTLTGDLYLAEDCWILGDAAGISVLSAFVQDSLDVFGHCNLGSVYVNADPVAALEVATKQYVDAHAGGGGGAYLPLTGGTVTGDITVTAGTGGAEGVITAEYLASNIEAWFVKSTTELANITEANIATGVFDNANITMTGDPIGALNIATKQYVDAHAGGGGLSPPPADGWAYGRVNDAGTESWTQVLGTFGGTVTGTTYFNADVGFNGGAYFSLVVQSSVPISITTPPTLPNHATTKAYVDARPATDSTKVLKAGDTMTGDLDISKSQPALTLNKTVTTSDAWVGCKFNGSDRWWLNLGDSSAEIGSNAGCNFDLTRYADNGTLIGSALFINRATGKATVAVDPTDALGIATKQYVDNKPGAPDATKVLKTGDTMTGPLALPVGSSADPSIQLGATAGTGISANLTPGLQFNTSGTARMTITGAAATYTVPLRAASGTASAPGLTFSADSSAGIYLNGADVGIATVNNPRMSFSSTVNTSFQPIMLPAGTSGAPPLSFTAETGMGIWRKSAGIFSIIVGGTEMLNLSFSGSSGYIIGSAADIRSKAAGKFVTSDAMWDAAAPVALTDAAAVITNLNLGIDFTLLFTSAVGATRTLNNPTNSKPGQKGVIYLIQDATGSRTVTWGTAWKFAGGTKPTLTTAANATDVLSYVVKDVNNIFCSFLGDCK